MNNPYNLPEGVTLTPTPGVKSAFQEYFDQKAERASKRKAEQAVADVQAEAKTKTPKVKAEKAPKVPKVNDKKVAAHRIFDANREKGNGEIATMIAGELEITYANAYYYVTRVFR